MTLAQYASRLKFLANENAPSLLTAAGAVGVVATAYFTGRATVKAVDLVDKEKDDFAIIRNGERIDAEMSDLPKIVIFKETWKCYIIPATVGTLSIACIVLANRASAKRMAALALSAGISERALQEYKTKVVEKLGERKATDIRDEIAQDRVAANPVSGREVIITGGGTVLCMDSLSGRYFMSTMEDIKRAENAINRVLNNFMHASLSEFYDELGLPSTGISDAIGWNGNSKVEVQVSTTLSTDNRPCLVLDFNPTPFSDYYRSLHD